MKIKEFSFGNYKSFKDEQSLNLTAAKIKSKNSQIDSTNLIKLGDGSSLLKAKAIYGANASGKSNVIRALGTFIGIIKNSVKDEKVLSSYIDSFKLSTETENEPTFFQLIFIHENVQYRYGFELTNKEILSEWLFGTPKNRELPFFIRENNKITKVDKTNFPEGHKSLTLFPEDEENDENGIFRTNSLFLSSLASFGFGKLSKKLVEAIKSVTVISGLGHPKMYDFARDALTENGRKDYIRKFLKHGDVGIKNLDTIEMESEQVVLSERTKYDENLKTKGTASFIFKYQESEGTVKLFELSPFIQNAINNETPLFIDEFDARFHPLLSKKIIELFNSETNKGAQLVFVTHDTNLLSSDLLRKDQIDFVEKDKYGASHLYTLVQFKGIRNTASFEKDYIQGKYGAIPFLGNFNQLFNADSNA